MANRASQIIQLNILIINKKFPFKVTHANREKVVGFNVFKAYLGPPAQFVRHCRMGVNKGGLQNSL